MQETRVLSQKRKADKQEGEEAFGERIDAQSKGSHSGRPLSR